MPVRLRNAMLVILALLLLPARSGLADDLKTAKCPRCEQRFVVRTFGAKPKGKAPKDGRVCRVQSARFDHLHLAEMWGRRGDEERRQRVLELWNGLRKSLLLDGYQIVRADGENVVRLLPLQSKAALALALFDEAQRCTRRATWSQQMADALKKGRVLWRRVSQADAKRANAAYEDLLAAWEERARLFRSAAKRYRAQALDPGATLLVGGLPKPGRPKAAISAREGDGLVSVVEELREALRILLLSEHRYLKQLLTATRGEKAGSLPEASAFEKLRDLSAGAFSTAIVVNLHSRRVREMDLLRSNLITDGSLEHFFERAPVLAKALLRRARPKSAVGEVPRK